MNYRIIISLLVALIVLAAGHAARATELANACAADDIVKVKTILANHTELLKSKDSYGRTPLHYAAQKGHVEICELLISYKANIEAKVEDRSPAGYVNWTPL